MEDETFQQFQKDVAALARISGMNKRQETEDCSDYEPDFRAQKAARESMSESIESLPANSYDAAVQRIPLEVRRLCDDDDPKAWSQSVSWATDPHNVVNPSYLRRSTRWIGPKVNTAKTVY